MPDQYWLPRHLESLKLIRAAHILVVSDSCWSGGLFKESYPSRSGSEPMEELIKLMELKSRSAIASGGLEPVEDSKTENGRSVFANAFLQGLKEMPSGVFTADRLFYEYIKPLVGGQTRQTAEINMIHNSGDKSGRFIFRRR